MNVKHVGSMAFLAAALGMGCVTGTTTSDSTSSSSSSSSSSGDASSSSTGASSGGGESSSAAETSSSAAQTSSSAAETSSSAAETSSSAAQTSSSAETSSSAAGGSSSSGGNASSGAPTLASCSEYCATIATNCTDANAQYGSNDLCLASCLAMPPGAVTDTSGNTRGCRAYHAEAAASNATLHCPHAGPGGGGACGTPCDHYCDIVEDACSGTYANRTACLDACEDMLSNEATPTAASGDTVQCRTYHAQVAQETPDPHCTHVDEDSPPCSDTLPATQNSPCAVGDYVTANPASGAVVEVATTVAFQYSPKCLKIRKGAQVRIDASQLHPLQGINSGSPWEGGAYTSAQTRTLDTAGVYPYYCTAHGTSTGTGMAGAVWVVE